MTGVSLDPVAVGPVRVLSWQGLSGIRRPVSRVTEFAPATLCLTAAIVGVWFLERALAGQVHGGRGIGYMAFGALPNADIIGRGDPSQLWRWVSSGLVHNRTNPLNIASNSLALLMIGSVIERLYGRLVMLACVALGVATGSFFWMLASALSLVAEPDSTIGVSAGICALLGIRLVYWYRERRNLTRARMQAMKFQAALGLAAVVLFGVVVPNLNNVAHAGGLMAGMVVAFALPTTQDGSVRALGLRTRTAFWIVLLATAVSVLLAGENLIGRLLLPA